MLTAAALAGVLIGTSQAQVASPELSMSDVELKNLSNYASMVRVDLRKQKRALIGDSIGLDPAKKDKFWAVYGRFENELKSLWDTRLANTKRYADTGDTITDASVDALAKEFLKNDARMSALRAKYYGEFKAAVGPKLAARFLHIESVLDRIVELQMLAIVPMVR